MMSQGVQAETMTTGVPAASGVQTVPVDVKEPPPPQMEVNKPVPTVRGGGSVKVGGVTVVGSGRIVKPKGVIKKKKKECVHDEGGWCSLHGVVGKLKWKPMNVLAVGTDGKMKYEYKIVKLKLSRGVGVALHRRNCLP